MMINKFLEKKVQVVFDGYDREKTNVIELEYYLLETDSAEDDGNEDQKMYGVEIIEKRQGIPNETKQFNNIFTTRLKTRNLIELLAENTVTPLSLPYILDDMLGV